MNITFERTSYLMAVKENFHFNNEDKIFKYAKTNLNFKYGDVGVEEFNEKYSANGWFGRKVIALPAAIWSAIVKTIYHFVKGMNFKFAKELSHDQRYFQSQIFCIRRDFQEAFGWLISLFDDRYGQYLIQESKFHETCYNYFLSNMLRFNVQLQDSNFNHPRSSCTRVVENDSQQKDLSDILSTPLPNPEPKPHKTLKQSHEPRDVDNEFSEIRSLSNLSNSLETEEQWSNLAKAYLQKGDRAKALTTIKKIRFDTKTKEAVIIQIAEAYFQDNREQDNLGKALKTIKEIGDYETKESFIAKIADSYLIKNNRELALKTILEICHNRKIKLIFLVQLAQSYYTANNEKGVLKSIEEIVKASFIQKINKIGSFKIYIKICKDNIRNNTVQNFFSRLASNCYEQIKEGFVSQAPEEILKITVEKTTDQSSIDEFLRLEKK